MKKLLFAAATIIFSMPIFSQSCVQDAWYSLQADQVAQATRTIDECLANNQNSAKVWLMRGNAYLKWYGQVQERLKKKADYKYKGTAGTIVAKNAILIADSSFLKAITLDPQVQPEPGMFNAIDGQIYCAPALYEMAEKALKAGQLEDAYLYYNLSAKNFKLDKINNMSNDLGYIYGEAAKIAKQLNDDNRYKQSLQEAINAKAPQANIYWEMYDFNLKQGDTAACGKVVNAAKKNISQDQIVNAYQMELDYLSMINEPEKLGKVADKLVKKYSDNADIISLVSAYLINAMEFEKADSALLAGLATNPDNFSLNSQMGYRYIYEAAESYGKLIDEATKAKNWDKRTELTKERAVVLEKALEYADKAYKINPDDMENNIRLQQIYVQLQRIADIPADLKAKVDSYKKN